MFVKVSEKGQIVIPAKLRRKYNLKRGAKLEVCEKKGKIELEPILKDPVIKLRGKYKGMFLTEELIKERAIERKKENFS